MEHYWRDLPGPMWFSGADIYRRYVASVGGPSVAVELGAWKGRSTCCMGVEIANSGKPISFHTVDHWQGVAGEEGYDADPDEAAGRLFATFHQNIAPVASHVNVIRADSASAASRFADGAVDFLYVDASHTYSGVLRDLAAWFPKVKPGGLIAGDDWCFSVHGEHCVRNAVEDFFGRTRSCIATEPGSAPNAGWLQWSAVKTPDLQPASAAKLLAYRTERAIQRSAPARILRAAGRRLFPWST